MTEWPGGDADVGCLRKWTCGCGICVSECERDRWCGTWSVLLGNVGLGFDLEIGKGIAVDIATFSLDEE